MQLIISKHLFVEKPSLKEKLAEKGDPREFNLGKTENLHHPARCAQKAVLISSFAENRRDSLKNTFLTKIMNPTKMLQSMESVVAALFLRLKSLREKSMKKLGKKLPKIGAKWTS
jgi:hypothetical protein